MIFRKRRDTGNYRRKHYLALFTELDLERLYLSYDRWQDE